MYLGKKVGWQASSAGLEEMGGAGGKDWSGGLGRGQKVDELSLVPSLAFTRSKGTSLVMHWLRLCAPSAGDVDLIPGQGTKIPHAVQPTNLASSEGCVPQLESLCTTTKDPA